MLLSLGSSDLEMNTLPTERRSDNLQACGHPEHFWARWIGKENSNVMRVDHAQHAHHERRQTNKDPRRQSALCRAYPHIAINAKAVADHSGEPVQNFCQVCASFFLAPQRVDNKTHVDQRYAFGHV